MGGNAGRRECHTGGKYNIFADTRVKWFALNQVETTTGFDREFRKLDKYTQIRNCLYLH